MKITTSKPSNQLAPYPTHQDTARPSAHSHAPPNISDSFVSGFHLQFDRGALLLRDYSLTIDCSGGTRRSRSDLPFILVLARPRWPWRWRYRRRRRDQAPSPSMISILHAP